MSERTLESVEAENLRLRAALAESEKACVYCQLPAEEFGQCRAGFPGCARMDDLTGCPEFGAAMQAEQIEEGAKTFVEFVLRHTWPERAQSHGFAALHSVIKHHPFAQAFGPKQAGEP